MLPQGLAEAEDRAGMVFRVQAGWQGGLLLTIIPKLTLQRRFSDAQPQKRLPLIYAMPGCTMRLFRAIGPRILL